MQFSYFLNQIKYCSNEKELVTVAGLIAKIVPTDHPDLPILVSAGRAKRKELNSK